MVAVVFRGGYPLEHRGLLQCALARDSAGARRILAAHIDGCVEHALRTGVLDRFLDRRGRTAAGYFPGNTGLLRTG